MLGKPFILRLSLPGIAVAAMLQTIIADAATPFCDPGGGNTTTYTYTSIQAETGLDWTHDFVFQQFDPTLGQLEEVTITVCYDMTSCWSLVNASRKSGQAWLQCGSAFSLAVGGSNAVVSIAGSQIHSSLSAGACADYGPYGYGNDFCPLTLTLEGDDLAPFIGTNDVVLTGSTHCWDSIREKGGSIQVDLTATAGAVVTVQYLDKIAVPEPWTGSLLFCGLVLLAWTRRFRQTR